MYWICSRERLTSSHIAEVSLMRQIQLFIEQFEQKPYYLVQDYKGISYFEIGAQSVRKLQRYKIPHLLILDKNYIRKKGQM